jgi:hypothetical protein
LGKVPNLLVDSCLCPAVRQKRDCTLKITPRSFRISKDTVEQRSVSSSGTPQSFEQKYGSLALPKIASEGLSGARLRRKDTDQIVA